MRWWHPLFIGIAIAAIAISGAAIYSILYRGHCQCPALPPPCHPALMWIKATATGYVGAVGCK